MGRQHKKRAREKPTKPANQKPRRTALGLIVAGSIAVGFGGSAVAIVLLRDAPGGPAGKGLRAAPLPPAPSGEQEPPEVMPAFTDVTREAGMSFRHTAGSTGKFYYPEVMGAGCAFFDADGDGLLDIYLVNGNLLPPEAPSPDITNVLYRNNGDGTFTDVTAEAGVGDPSYGQGCCAADYSGNGYQDLYVTNFGPNVLYRNEGNGRFTHIPGVADDPGWGQACAFFDMDGDGDLDLYVQNYLVYSLEDHQEWYVVIDGRRVLDYCSPHGYHGQQDRLYRNDGDDVFTDVTEERGIVIPEGTGMGLLIADLDNNGSPDIVVANDTRPNFYFENDGRGYFTETALTRGVAYNAQGGVEAFMGIDAADYDGDGLLDLVIPSLRTEGFNLYKNFGTMFRDVSIASGLDGATSGVTGFAPVFLDYDRDGCPDLFFTTGEVRMGRVTAGAGTSFEERYAAADLLLHNRQGRFVPVSHFAGPAFRERRVSRACSRGDYNNDGNVDLLVTAMNAEARLLRNDTRGGRWIGFALTGRAPNLDAVGARLHLKYGGRERMNEIMAGGSYLGQADRRVIFGLGDCTAIEELRVRWPNGEETAYRDLAIDQYHALRQESP